MTVTDGGRPRGRRRRLAAVLVVIVAAGLVTLAPKLRRAARDWSRDEVARRAENVLEEALGADVEVGSASLPTLRELHLADVHVTNVAGLPELEELILPEVRAVPGGGASVTGSWDGLDVLEIRGAVLTLRPPESGAAAEAGEARERLRVGRLIVKDALVVLRSRGPGDVGALRLDGELRDWGSEAMRGTARARASHVPLRALVETFVPQTDGERLRPLMERLGGCCGAAEADVAFAADGAVTASGRLVVPAGFPGEVEPERVVTLGAEGRGDVVVRASSPDLVEATAIVRRDGATWALGDVVAELPRLPSAWLGQAPGRFAWDDARVTARTWLVAGDRRVDVHAATPELRVSLPKAAIPLRDAGIHVTGLVEERGFDGDASLTLAGRPTAAVAGRVRRAGQDVTLDVGWTLARDAASRHESLLRAAGLPLPDSWTLVSAREAAGRARGVLGGALETDADLRGIVVRLGPDASAAQAIVDRGSAALDLGGESLRIRDARLEGILRTTGLPDVRVEASASGDSINWRGSAVARGGEGLGELRAKASSGRKGGTLTASLDGGNAPAWLRLLLPESSSRLGLQATREAMEARLEARWDARRRFTFTGTGSSKALSAQSADSTHALTIEGVRWSVEGEGSPDTVSTARLRAAADGAQLLWGSAFADLSAMPPSIEADVVLTPDEPWRAEVRARLGRALQADARVRGGGGEAGVVGDVALRVPDASATWADLRTSGLLAAWPRADKVTLAGDLSFRAEGSWSEGGFGLDGEARIAGGALADESLDLELRGLDLELPVGLARAAGDERVRVEPSALAGRVRASRVALLGAEASAVDLPLRATDDAVRADGDVALAWLGGTATLSDVTLRDPLASGRALQGGLRLNGLQLSRLGPVGPFTLEASVSASFPSITASATSLQVEGGARVLAWGGEIVVDEIAGTNPWSRFPRTRISAHFSGVDLFELTSTFGFGAMTGVVHGEVEGLELFGLAPSAFRARVQTEDVEGAKKTISIPALQNLATLATGGRAPLFDKGLLKLVRTLRYDEVGMEASLRADAFMLRGLAERHGRELFLKGRLPLRVDVANAQPGATVSFRAMMARLAGLDAAPPPAADAPETDPEAPEDEGGSAEEPPPSDERTP